MDVDAVDLQVAKAALRRAPKVAGMTFRGVPVEADVFDRDDLLAMLAISQDWLRRERAAHDATMGAFKSLSATEVGV